MGVLSQQCLLCPQSSLLGTRHISLLGVNIILAHTVVRQVPLIHKLCMLSFPNEAVGFLVEPVLDGGCQVMVSIETFL